MLYSDFSIDLVLQQMAEIFNKKSTPTRICGILLEASEIIRQLRQAAAPPPNAPLTLEELREMDGQPVWFCKCHNGLCNWCVIDHTNETNIFFTDGTVRLMSSYGDGWMAYSRRPEEVENG